MIATVIDRAEQGRLAEIQACAYLKKQGLKLLEKNFHCRYGEIDLIMSHGKTLIFVEVRYRRNNHFGGPLASITPQKQQRLLTTAQVYLQQHPQPTNTEMRFDVVALTLDPGNQETKIEWIQNAIEN